VIPATANGENLFGEMLGSVSFDGTELFCGYRRRRRSFEQSLSALLAKLRPEPVCPAAIWAGDFKPRAAALAEHSVAWIMDMAIKAVHGAANLSLSERTASRTRILARIEPDKCLGSIVGNTPSNRISKTVRFWVVGCGGIDHIMVGTDYPYDLGDWDAAKKVEQLDIPEADKMLMLEGNAKKLLRIK